MKIINRSHSRHSQEYIITMKQMHELVYGFIVPTGLALHVYTNAVLKQLLIFQHQYRVGQNKCY